MTIDSARAPKPPLFLPSRQVAEGVAVPNGWVPHPFLDGWMPPGRPAVSTEQVAMQNTTQEA